MKTCLLYTPYDNLPALHTPCDNRLLYTPCDNLPALHALRQPACFTRPMTTCLLYTPWPQRITNHTLPGLDLKFSAGPHALSHRLLSCHAGPALQALSCWLSRPGGASGITPEGFATAQVTGNKGKVNSVGSAY
eukprot:scaffold36198_cov19-Tisochrysis_lutea.AAC.2